MIVVNRPGFESDAVGRKKLLGNLFESVTVVRLLLCLTGQDRPLPLDYPLNDFTQRKSAAIAEACTSCGACVEICPVIPHAGLSVADAPKVLKGLLSTLKAGRRSKERPPNGCNNAIIAVNVFALAPKGSIRGP